MPGHTEHINSITPGTPNPVAFTDMNLERVGEVETKEDGRRTKQEKIFTGMAEFNPVQTVVGEVLKQNKRRAEHERRPLNDKAIRIQARGHFFEMYALAFLHEIDEPPHPELSAALLETVRDPSLMISELSELLEKAENLPEEYQPVAERFEEKKGRLGRKFATKPRNNDAIAIKTEVDEQGEVSVLVTGSYEMKNYFLTGKESEADVRDQLKQSKSATLDALRELGQYLPMYLALKGHEKVPAKVAVTSTKKFTQTLVQPEGMFKRKKDLFAQMDYEGKDWEGYEIKYAPINMEELSAIYPEFEQEVVNALRQVH